MNLREYLDPDDYDGPDPLDSYDEDGLQDEYDDSVYEPEDCAYEGYNDDLYDYNVGDDRRW